MPNTPALVGCAATVFVRGTYVDDQSTRIVKNLFSAVGLCEELNDESMLDAVTALAGSGPAYVKYYILLLLLGISIKIFLEIFFL